MIFMATSESLAALQQSYQYSVVKGKPKTTSEVNPSGNSNAHEEI